MTAKWARDRLDALVAGEAEPPPVVKTMKLGTVDAWGEGWAKKIWHPDPAIMNGDGSMFGGYIAALADQIIAFAAMSVVPEGKAFRTLNLTTTFLRVGKAEPLSIEARVTSQTRQMIAVRAVFTRPDGKPIAEAHGQQFLQAFPQA